MPRWLKVLLALLLLLAVAAATVPWWASAAAKPFLARRGITWVDAQANGFRTMHIKEVHIARGNTTVVIHDVQAPSPLFWLRASARHATAGTWSVNVKASDPSTPPRPGTVVGMPTLHAQLQKIVRTLQRWLPVAEVGAGEVQWPRGRLKLAGATWRNSALAGRELQYRGQTFDLTIDASPGDALLLHAQQPARELAANLNWKAAKASGVITWSGQSLPVEATFPATGWWPETGEARAENWNIPADRIALGRQYRDLTGHGRLAWHGDGFTVSVHAEAAPKADVPAPPLKAEVSAEGDLTGVTIHALQVDAPFARATLDAPITFGWHERTIASAAHLTIDADLAKQTFIEARGRLKGSVTAAPGNRRDFSLEVEEAGIEKFAIQRLAARGHWNGRELILESSEIRLDESTHARVSGTLEWENRALAGVTFDAQAAPAAFARWLPAGTTWTQATVKGVVGGTLDAPAHSGEAFVTGAKGGALKPFDLRGTWHGVRTTIDEFSAEMSAAKSRLRVAGAADSRGLSLRELVFAPAGVEQLTLAAPARVEWAPNWHVSGVRLHGPTATIALQVATGPSATFHLSAANLDKEWIHDWLDLRGPTWRVRQLDFAGQQVAGVMDFTASLRGEIHLPGREVAQLSLVGTGNRDGIRLTELNITEAGAQVTKVSGHVAASWVSDARPHLRIDRDAPLELQAVVLPTSPLWAALGEPARVTIAGASAEARVTGTLAQPAGHLRAAMETLEVADESPWRARLPDVAGLALAASGDRAQVRLDSFKASIEGQEMRGWARVPMSEDRWRQLMTAPAKFDWREIEARLEVPGADLSALAQRLPNFFAARGRLQASVELAPGGKLSGSLSLRDAATRPLPALGVIQEIRAEIRFADRTARIESFAGVLGGEPVQLQGSVDLPPGEAPRPHLQLTGKNLPLVRKAGLLVRSDLDLQAQTENNRTRITGVVTLRDCLLLADFSDLLPTGVRGTKRQPPYFSVAAEPYNHWGLAIELRGISSVRMRTPFFTGSGSAHFTLSGNLGEPRAVGEITVEEGKLFFPFATFTVENGEVRLRSSDPFHPELTLNAISRRHNYELRLEASGPPEAPVLVFTSNPALEAGQVLAMVMAGQIPANETTGTAAQGGLRLTQLGAYLGQGIYRGLGGTDENRLEIVAGERVSRQGRETYEVEYKLGESWSLVGEYDEFDSYNAGLKWRVYKQESGHGK